MPVPILKQRDYLIASIRALNDEDLKKLREALVAQVGEFRSRGVIVDRQVRNRARLKAYDR